MGTRALYGFKKSGELKLTYCHSDGEPSMVGVPICNFIKETDLKTLNKIFDNIIMVDYEGYPTDEQFREIEKFADDLDLSEVQWYHILRPTQGFLDIYKKNFKYMGDMNIYANWVYLINLDNNRFEIYESDNENPCASFDLTSIPEDWLEQIREDEEDD